MSLHDSGIGECLVLIAHGSRNRRWTELLQGLAAELQTEVGSEKVRLAFMELSKPSLFDIAEEVYEPGMSLRILPLFMANGNHLAYDIPEQLNELAQRFPGMKVEMLPPLGEHREFLNVIKEVARGYVRD